MPCIIESYVILQNMYYDMQILFADGEWGVVQEGRGGVRRSLEEGKVPLEPQLAVKNQRTCLLVQCHQPVSKRETIAQLKSSG